MIEVKDKNILMLLHAVVFAVIMYFGSMYLFAPLLAEGWSDISDDNGKVIKG